MKTPYHWNSWIFSTRNGSPPWGLRPFHHELLFPHRLDHRPRIPQQKPWHTLFLPTNMDQTRHVELNFQIYIENWRQHDICSIIYICNAEHWSIWFYGHKVVTFSSRRVVCVGTLAFPETAKVSTAGELRRPLCSSSSNCQLLVEWFNICPNTMSI